MENNFIKNHKKWPSRNHVKRQEDSLQYNFYSKLTYKWPAIPIKTLNKPFDRTWQFDPRIHMKWNGPGTVKMLLRNKAGDAYLNKHKDLS